MEENQPQNDSSLSDGRIVNRPLHAPREDRESFADPPLTEVSNLARRNVQLLKDAAYDFQGRSLAELRASARAALIKDARRWTGEYRSLGSNSNANESLIFLAGHQPRLFHPGVWWKNFALGAMARKHGATAVNLIVDSDTVQDASLRVPVKSDAVQTISVPMDQPAPPMAYEERPIVDRRLFADFGRRVKDELRAIIPNPLIETYWPLVLDRAEHGGNLGACIAQARHRLEGDWGVETLEVPQSRVCESEAFLWFTAFMLAQLPRLRAVYNESVHEYRQVYKVRSSAHPVPDLAMEEPWMEAPYWIWTADNRRRRRLFAYSTRDCVRLSDRESWTSELPLRADGDASAAVERLQELAASGVKIRSRALITTLWARLVLGDLFVHGIGGAKYDQVTDAIMQRFFKLAPPGFMVISATLRLPVEQPRATDDDARELQRNLRDLTYHPEKHLLTSGLSPSLASEYVKAIADKSRWIETPQTPQNAKTRCGAIRRANEMLQPCLAAERTKLEHLQTRLSQDLRAKSILSWREYAFCLFPEEYLRNFFQTLLHNNG
jgi:hypothetical protein